MTELENFFRNLITRYLDWFRKVQAWLARRDQSIQQLDFPYVDYRRFESIVDKVVLKQLIQTGATAIIMKQYPNH